MWRGLGKCGATRLRGLCPQALSPDALQLSSWGWAMAVLFILGATIALGKGLVGFWAHAVIGLALASIGLCGVLITVRKLRWGT